MTNDPSIRRITCEHPEQKMWDLFLFLECEPTARRLLEDKYRRQGIENPERAAFHAAEPLIYYLRHARELYQVAGSSNLLVRPLVAYYGMMNLLKAWLLSLDPAYPHSTSVLRHGLSTRRRKRSNYRFVKDEVRIQREGLFSLAAQSLGQTGLEGNTYTLQTLLAAIPELQASYQALFHDVTFYPVFIPEQKSVQGKGMPFFIEESILDAYHLTAAAFVERLNRYRPKADYRFLLHQPAVTGGNLTVFWLHNRISHVNRWSQGFDHPWFREDVQGGIYLYAGKCRPAPLPEILIHFMLLFALSMLSRYDPPVWGEIVFGFGSEDLVLIHEFLQVTQRKFPHLILNLLFEEKFLFS